MTHWQSFFSNGLETGLAVLDLLGKRVHSALGGEVQWTSCMELTEQAIAEWKRF